MFRATRIRRSNKSPLLFPIAEEQDGDSSDSGRSVTASSCSSPSPSESSVTSGSTSGTSSPVPVELSPPSTPRGQETKVIRPRPRRNAISAGGSRGDGVPPSPHLALLAAREALERKRRLDSLVMPLQEQKLDCPKNMTPRDEWLVEGQIFEVPSTSFLTTVCTASQPYLTAEQLSRGFVVVGPFESASEKLCCQVQHIDRLALSLDRAICFFDPAHFEHDRPYDPLAIALMNPVHEKAGLFDKRRAFRGDRYCFATIDKHCKQVLPRDGYPARRRLTSQEMTAAVKFGTRTLFKDRDQVILSKIHRVLQENAEVMPEGQAAMSLTDLAAFVFDGELDAKADDVHPFVMQMAFKGVIGFLDDKRSLISLL